MERLVRIAAVLKVADRMGVTAERLLQVGEYHGERGLDELGRDLRYLRQQGWQIDNVADPGEPARYRMVTVDNRWAADMYAEHVEVIDDGELAVVLELELLPPCSTGSGSSCSAPARPPGSSSRRASLTVTTSWRRDCSTIMRVPLSTEVCRTLRAESWMHDTRYGPAEEA